MPQTDPLPERAVEAGRLLAYLFGPGDTAFDVGGHFSCSEAEDLATVLRALDQPDAAQWWLYLHGRGDEDPGCDCDAMGDCADCGDPRNCYDQHFKLKPPDGVNPFTGETQES